MPENYLALIERTEIVGNEDSEWEECETDEVGSEGPQQKDEDGVSTPRAHAAGDAADVTQ